VLETGFTDAVTKVTLVNPEDVSFGAGTVGLVCRYLDSTHLWRLTYEKFPGTARRLRLHRTFGSFTATVIDVNITLTDNDTISVAYCGPNFEIFVNDASQGTYDDSPNPQAYGTQCGLTGFQGVLGSGGNNYYDDFLVETNGTCTPTYNCVADACVDPGDGSGTYATLEACLEGCSVPASYDCLNNECFDPGDGSGEFATLLACQESGCGVPPTSGISTERFDAGMGTDYYIIPQLSDSGEELRSKNIKAGYVIGKKTNASIQFFGFDVNQEINPDEIAAGTRLPNSTSPQSLPDSAQVTQSQRKQVNVKNATNHTVRVAGNCTGEEIMDRIDQISYEVDIQGVRR
jgi:hypothetical protein